MSFQKRDYFTLSQEEITRVADEIVELILIRNTTRFHSNIDDPGLIDQAGSLLERAKNDFIFKYLDKKANKKRLLLPNILNRDYMISDIFVRLVVERAGLYDKLISEDILKDKAKRAERSAKRAEDYHTEYKLRGVEPKKLTIEAILNKVVRHRDVKQHIKHIEEQFYRDNPLEERTVVGFVSDYVDWHELCRNPMIFKYPDVFENPEFKKHIKWDLVSRLKMTEEFVEKHLDDIRWDSLSSSGLKIPMHLIKKYSSRIKWDYVSRSRKKQLSDSLKMELAMKGYIEPE